MRTVRRVSKQPMIYSIVSFFAIFAALPFFWMVIAMFKASPDLYSPTNNPFIYNKVETLRRDYSDDIVASFSAAGDLLEESENPDVSLAGEYLGARSIARSADLLVEVGRSLAANEISIDDQAALAEQFEAASVALEVANADAAAHLNAAAVALRADQPEEAQQALNQVATSLREHAKVANPTLDQIKLLINDTSYTTFVFNSVFIGIFVVIVTLLAAVPAAYSLARIAGNWGQQLGIGMFLVYLVPPTLLFIPMTWVIAQLNLQDSRWSLILVYPTFTIPFCTWLLMGFMKTIPKDIEEQALIDGYSRIGALVRVVLPLSLPGILTVVVFAFMLSLHEFIYALAFIQGTADKPISTGVPTELFRGDVFFWQPLMAAAVFVAIPVAIVYNLFLDRFIAGLTMGAVKG